ncbi:hypothetical protein CH63R_10310 [Colletotrichum higginsianum IMI 349063]|uniref:Uncharacterized protein n=1 Tax=Colletotrichum higginsianum (strain IMI 349063) TaxID=759273 RepID=A0A1B7Y2G3_COLHI|nr:uncharacterized protein CH63R_10310 [Colletotrichum higginsianum IMI 349063]OBR06190.1 hypothetical protein CH63R_10310 [Colletotrichum higginsianum IMI 349063]
MSIHIHIHTPRLSAVKCELSTFQSGPALLRRAFRSSRVAWSKQAIVPTTRKSPWAWGSPPPLDEVVRCRRRCPRRQASRVASAALSVELCCLTTRICYFGGTCVVANLHGMGSRSWGPLKAEDGQPGHGPVWNPAQTKLSSSLPFRGPTTLEPTRAPAVQEAKELVVHFTFLYAGFQLEIEIYVCAVFFYIGPQVSRRQAWNSFGRLPLLDQLAFEVARAQLAPAPLEQGVSTHGGFPNAGTSGPPVARSRSVLMHHGESMRRGNVSILP